MVIAGPNLTLDRTIELDELRPGEVLRAERARRLFDAIDGLDAKYGKHTVFLGSSFAAMQGQQHTGDRAELPRRRRMLLPGEGERKRLGIPFLGDVR